MKNNLKEIRKKKGLLQVKVAMDLNTTQETISSYESGRRFPGPEMLVNLANYYNTSIDYILGRKEENNNNLSKEETKVIEKWRKLSDKDKSKVEGYIDGLNDK